MTAEEKRKLALFYGANAFYGKMATGRSNMNDEEKEEAEFLTIRGRPDSGSVNRPPSYMLVDEHGEILLSAERVKDSDDVLICVRGQRCSDVERIGAAFVDWARSMLFPETKEGDRG